MLLLPQSKAPGVLEDGHDAASGLLLRHAGLDVSAMFVCTNLVPGREMEFSCV